MIFCGWVDKFFTRRNLALRARFQSAKNCNPFSLILTFVGNMDETLAFLT